MSAGTEGVVHYDVTRIRLMDALADVPLTRDLHLEARGRMADALLGQMPEARGEADGHYVTFQEDSWVVTCPYAASVERVTAEGAPDAGRWRITGISEGLPDLERVEPQP